MSIHVLAHGRRLAALAVLLTACSPASPAGTPAPAPAEAATAERRAIVVSFDAMNERRMLETVDSAAVPTFRALFAGGACTDGARPAFPSLTSPGHAALWTGAYGNVNGIAANAQPELPQPGHTLRESISGYLAEALRAEPIWLAAARAGVSVYGHHVTQAPGAPGYPPVRADEPRLVARRAAAESLLALPGVQVVNGYNREIAPAIALTARSAPPRDAAGWRNLDRLGATVAPREIAWAVGSGPDSLHALFYGREHVDRVLVARTRDAAAGVTALAAPVERAPVAGRELARHFSPPLEVPVPGGRVYVRVRLFDVAPDGSDYLLFVPELQVVEGNRPAVAAAYDAAVQGWYGNSGLHLAERGGLGPMMTAGGDGTAELRYLETAEQMTRSFMRGAEWAWTTQRPRLFLSYFPGIDEVDHSPIHAMSTPGVPGYDAARAARLRELRARAWQLADLQLAQFRRFAGSDPNTALFVSGDHGMRVYWRTFQPNVALARAGLLATDGNGRIDLARTKALSPNGYWVMVNRTAWKGGIVPPAEEAAVLAAARRALEGVRGADGQPVVTRLWRGDEADSLGIGGPVGGDLYYDVADGYFWSTAATGPLVRDVQPMGAHGFPSVRDDMQTVLCMTGAAVQPHRLPRGRTMDLAPTVSEWLGMQPPLDAVGHSILGALLPGSPLSRPSRGCPPPRAPAWRVPGAGPGRGVPGRGTARSTGVARMWKSGWISNVRRVVAPVAIALLSACGGGDDTTAPPPPTGADALSAVHVTPATASVTVGASTRLSASGLDAHGRAVAGVSIAWVALDPSVATVEADGTVTGVQAGEARVVASASGFADTAVVAVSAEPGSEPGPTLAASVQVSPGALSLQPGGGYQLAALVFDASSQPLTTRTLAWRSLEPAAATVSAAGYVNAVAEGTARLVAEVDGASDTVTVIVARAMAPTPVPASVAVTPATLTLAAGGTRQLTATVRDAGGQALTGYSVVWSVGDGSVATVSSTGLVTAVDGGTTTITAVAAGRSASATLTVTPAPVASVVVTPGSGVLVAGGTLQLTATPYSAAEKPLSGRSVSWTSSNSGVVRVSSTGLVTAVAAGTATVSATVEGRIGMASIQVSATAPTPVASVTIAPTSVSLEPGHAQQFTATARDAGGQTLTGRAVTWSGGSATVATVSASGLVTAVGVGSTTVTATVEGRTAQATVIVTAPPPVRETRSLAATTRGTMARDSTGAELPLPGVLVAGDDEAGGLAPLQAVVVFSLADIPAGATIESATLPVTMDPAGIFGDPYALGALHVERSTDVSMNLGAVSAGAIQLAAAPTASVTADLRALLQAAVDAGEPYLILRIRFEQAGNGNDATDQLELAVGELGIAWLK